MTKIGEGGQAHYPTEAMYQQKLQDSIIRFQNALSAFEVAKDPDEMQRLQTLMTEQMAAINTSIKEIRRAGIQKEGERIQNDYDHFKKNPSPESYTNLEQDMATLKEYAFLPLTNQEKDSSFPPPSPQSSNIM